MMKYVEIIEEVDELNDYRPREIFRQYVADDLEAEKVYSEKIKDFKVPVKCVVVDMNHDIDPKKNSPCVSRRIVDGKVELVKS